MPHPSTATTEPAGSPACLVAAPSVTGKRRGNPDLGLALRCGAHTRGGCPCRAPAIRGKLRCRMHGGRSTGPRTPEGMARLRAARTVHGGFGAEMRAFNRHSLTALRRGRVGNAAVGCFDRLPPDLAERLMGMPAELLPPPWPTGGLTPAEDRAVLRAETEALAPWRAAIAQAGVKGWAGMARPAVIADRSGAQAEPHAPVCAGDMGDAALGCITRRMRWRNRQNPMHQSAAAIWATPPWAHHPPLRWQNRQNPMHLCAPAIWATPPWPRHPALRWQRQAEPHAPVCAGDTGEAAVGASPTAAVAAQAEPHAPEQRRRYWRRRFGCIIAPLRWQRRQNPMHQCVPVIRARPPRSRHPPLRRQCRQKPMHQNRPAIGAAPLWLHLIRLRWQRRQNPMQQCVPVIRATPLWLHHPRLR